jgi:S-formylglutathione hydrolase FrmB
MKHLTILILGLLLLNPLAAQEQQAQFQLTFAPAVSDKPFTGRVLVMLGSGGEPRNGPNWFGPSPFFAKDVKDWKPGETLSFGSEAIGYPGPLSQLAAKEYTIQAVLDLDTANTHRIGSSPGNGYSLPVKAMLDPKKGFQVKLHIDQVVKENAPRESERTRFIEIESKLLSQFHGKPIKLRAGVKVPKSFATSPDKKYPVIYEIPGFGGNHRSVGRDPLTGNMTVEMLYVVLDPDCRTGHHVFADSVNNGPYGKALIEELVPAIEKQFRGIGQPTARFLTGHSSGGWSSLWLQVTYPDFFGGTWSTAPDPVDFRDFQRINLYDASSNMFTDASGAKRPLARRGDTPMIYYKPFSDMEVVMGRGGQLFSFEAVFSPKDGNGQPRQLWNRETGAIDMETARYWERYDIRLQLERNWKTLGPRLKGKLHVFMGDMDTFYLEGATKLLKESLKQLGSDAVVEIVPGKDHGSLMTREVYQRIAREMQEQFEKGHRANK